MPWVERVTEECEDGFGFFARRVGRDVEVAENTKSRKYIDLINLILQRLDKTPQHWLVFLATHIYVCRSLTSLHHFLRRWRQSTNQLTNRIGRKLPADHNNDYSSKRGWEVIVGHIQHKSVGMRG